MDKKREINMNETERSIDKAIDYRDEDEGREFDKMINALAEKIIIFFDVMENDDEGDLEDIKDIIRDFLVKWRDGEA